MVLDHHARAVGQPPVVQRLVEALVGLGEVHVLPHHGDLQLALRVREGLGDPPPTLQVRTARPDVEDPGETLIEALVVEIEGDLVDGLDVLGGDHGVPIDVAEERDLLLHRGREVPIAAAQDEVRRDPDGEQLLDGVLHGLGLELPRRGHEGDEGDVDVAGVLAPVLGAQLADGLEEGERLDVAHGAAHLDEEQIHSLGRSADALLDLVGDVGDDLDRAAQVVAPPLLRDHGFVDAAGGHVVDAAHRRRGEAFVVAEMCWKGFMVPGSTFR
jgi:hypothetical protein